MLFLPYKIDVDLKRIPFITILVILACLFIFKKQLDSNEKYVSAVNYYCSESLSVSMKRLVRSLDTAHLGCGYFWDSIRASNNPDAAMLELVNSSGNADKYDLERLKTEYAYFLKIVPKNLIDILDYDPGSLNIFKMISSSFTHASWSHVIGNLIFFYVFAAAVEVVVGSLAYLGIIFVMTITTSLAYSLSTLGNADAVPTVGLSGIVMGMVAMLGVMLPKVNIKCFFWFIIIFRTFRVPALFLAAWYVGWDFYDMKNDRGSNVNYVAHVSGALTGILFAFYYVTSKKSFVGKLRK